MAGVQCMVAKGDLPVDIRWTLNNEPVTTSEMTGFMITRLNMRTSALSIERLDGHHRGVYKCIAENKAGENEFIAELRVNGICILFKYF